jgi:hypothetical protein
MTRLGAQEGRAVLAGMNLAKSVKREFTLNHIHFSTNRLIILEKLLTDEEVFIMLSNICSIVQASWGRVRWVGRELEIVVTSSLGAEV